MRLHSIISTPGATRARKRVGRGEGSGRGKTSGRGQKGQKARSGGTVRPMFESGHIPLYRRLPTRGFSRGRFLEPVATVNVGELEKVGEVAKIDREVLIKNRLIRKSDRQVKILGEGEIGRAYTVEADRFSRSAREKIENAGGQVIALRQPSPETTGAEEGQA